MSLWDSQKRPGVVLELLKLGGVIAFVCDNGPPGYHLVVQRATNSFCPTSSDLFRAFNEVFDRN